MDKISSLLNEMQQALQHVKTVSDKIRLATNGQSSSKLLILRHVKTHPSSRQREITEGSKLHWDVVVAALPQLLRRELLTVTKGRFSITTKGAQFLDHVANDVEANMR